MKPEQQARIQVSMREWVKLTPEQRRLARENYLRSKKLNAEQKSAQWESYKNLPEAQKKKLLEEAKTKTRITNLPAATTAKQKPVVPIKSGNRDAQGKPKTPASAISPNASHPLSPSGKPVSSAPSLTPVPVTAPPMSSATAIAPSATVAPHATVTPQMPSTTPAASSPPAVSTSK